MSEEQLRRAAAVLESYRAQLETLTRQAEVVRVSLDEYRRARETILRYQEAGGGKEVLLPVGADSFVRATSTDPGKVLTSIGSDLVIEDTADNAAKRLEARIESLEKAAEAVGARMQEVQARADAQSAAVEELYAQTQGAPR